jgi:tripartite-type tricarboxylate transporter receptor subunit TctC
MANEMHPSKRLCYTLGTAVVPVLVAAGAILITVSVSLPAQTYPSKLIKLVVALVAGGPPDVMARLTAPALSARLGQTVIVENRPGGGGTIGTKQVATAPPDGHTLLFAGSNFALGPALIKNLGYDAVKDFAPIATVGSGSWVLVVAPSVPARSVKELVDYAKANPRKLSWGFSINTGPTLLGEMFVAATGIDVARIPYKGGPQAVGDLLGGHVHMNFNVTAFVLPLIREGKLRALAVTSEERSPDLPGVPTMAESGLPRLTRGFWTGLLAPAGTPAGIVNSVNAAINASLATSEMKASLAKLGYAPKAGSPEDFVALLAEEIEAWKAAAKAAGIVPH